MKILGVSCIFNIKFSDQYFRSDIILIDVYLWFYPVARSTCYVWAILNVFANSSDSEDIEKKGILSFDFEFYIIIDFWIFTCVICLWY